MVIDPARSPGLTAVAATIFVLAIPCFLVSLRRLARVREMPIAAVEKQIPLSLARLGIFVSVVAGTIALELASYALTGSRVLESLAGTAFGGSVTFVALREAYADLPVPEVFEKAYTRASIAVAALQTVMVALIGLQALWSLMRFPQYAWSETMGNAIFALAIFAVQANIVNAYFARRRLARGPIAAVAS
jgi:hypothetical protein